MSCRIIGHAGRLQYIHGAFGQVHHLHLRGVLLQSEAPLQIRCAAIANTEALTQKAVNISAWVTGLHQLGIELLLPDSTDLDHSVLDTHLNKCDSLQIGPICMPEKVAQLSLHAGIPNTC